MKKRVVYIFGNWKLHMTVRETEKFMEEFLVKIKTTSCVVGVAPPFTSIAVAAKRAQGSQIYVGAQNMSEHLHGAYTGEISAAMIKEVGAQFVLIGHSERRLYFHEDNQIIHHKIQLALQRGLMPILCIGETQNERERNLTKNVLASQLKEALQGVSREHMQKILIAYEPVWAIGTGQTATPEMVQESHHFCRSLLAHPWGDEIAKDIPILYGGSVKPENIAQLVTQPDVNGALIGGASLNVGSFVQIIKNSELG